MGQLQIWFKVRTMTKPTIVQRKDIKPEKDITGLETPVKSQEISVVIHDANHQKRQRFVTGSKLFHLDQSNNACCRLLIFWCVVTTLSSVISIYYAIDAQNRLYEATENVAMIKLNGNGENDMMENNNNNVIMEPRNRDNAGEKKRYLKRVVEKLGRKNIPDFKSLKNQAMNVINNFFKDENDDSNFIMVEVEDKWPNNNNPKEFLFENPNNWMMNSIRKLLDAPDFIKDFHDMLHPLKKMIRHREFKGQSPKLSTTKKLGITFY